MERSDRSKSHHHFYLTMLVKNPPPASGSLFLGVASRSASGRDLTRVSKPNSISGKPTSRSATRHWKKTSRHFHFAGYFLAGTVSLFKIWIFKIWIFFQNSKSMILNSNWRTSRVLICDLGLGAGGKSKQRTKGLEQFHPARKRERGVIFPLYIFHTVSYVCLFLDSISKDSIVSVQYPLVPIILPINLLLCQFDSTMTAIFNTALCEVKITLNIELTWQPPPIPGQSESLLAKAIQWRLHHGNIGRSDSVKEDKKYSKHYHYQCAENRA